MAHRRQTALSNVLWSPALKVFLKAFMNSYPRTRKNYPGRSKHSISSRAGLIAAAVAVGAAATAAWVEIRARRAEHDNPPTGQFISVDGVRLHYVMQGEGPVVVLLHGNSAMWTDFNACGLMQRLAKSHRVIAFDRPGFGHSSRPRDRLWTPSVQAALLHTALARLGIEQAVVVGHSIGAMVALAMALDYPAHVRSLVLIGGYYYPTVRVDALLASPVALPVLGDVMRYTVTALSARALFKSVVKAMFAPNDVPARFLATVPREMLLRPGQLRANAEDAAFMMPAAKALSGRYSEIKLPLLIIAGVDDDVVDEKAHSTRLHSELRHSELFVVPDSGHMAHYMTQNRIVVAIDSQLQALGHDRQDAKAAHSMAPQPESQPERQL